MKLLVLLLAATLFLSSLANAQEKDEDESLLPFQAPKSEVLPPAIPFAAVAVESYLLSVKLETLQKELIVNVHVIIELKNLGTGEVERTLKYVDDGILQLELQKGNYELTLRADKLETEGSDYFASARVDVAAGENLTINMFPVGSVSGVAYDKDDKVVQGAVVRFECSAKYGSLEPTATDSFGTFSSDSLPVGSCRLSAQHSNYVGHKQILIQHGQLADVEFVLDKRLATSNYQFYLAIVVVVLIAAVAAAYLTTRKARVAGIGGSRKEAEKAEAEAEEGKAAAGEKPELSRRSRDIMKTLSGNERKVVEFLLKQQDNEFEATQAKIFYNTGIPKTSLVRLIKALENKKIVDVKRIAKAKKVRLTPWFLSGEEPSESGPGKVPE